MPTTTATTAVKLSNVQETLLLPLWGRAVEAKKAHPLLLDTAAVRIIHSIDYDFSTIAANISCITQLSWIARSLHIDEIVRQFTHGADAATIVNLGCGLDTTFERVDDGRLLWYDLDLPDVIELRANFIEEGPRRKFIAGSILDEEWMGRLASGRSILFIAAGVLYYFEEQQVKTLMRRLADRFPGSEFAFDACSPRGVKMANKKVIEGGGMDENARLIWGINRAAEIHEWDPRITVLAEYPIVHGMRSGLSLKEKWGTLLTDTLRVMSMVHLRMGNKVEAGH